MLEHLITGKTQYGDSHATDYQPKITFLLGFGFTLRGCLYGILAGTRAGLSLARQLVCPLLGLYRLNRGFALELLFLYFATRERLPDFLLYFLIVDLMLHQSQTSYLILQSIRERQTRLSVKKRNDRMNTRKSLCHPFIPSVYFH